MRHDDLVKLLAFLADSANSEEDSWWSPGTYEGLLHDTRDEDVPIYVCSKHHYMHAVAVKTSRLKKSPVADLVKWNFSVPSGAGWDAMISGDKLRGVQDRGLTHTAVPALEGCTSLLFLRSGLRESGTYMEPNQALTHTLDLHADETGWVRSNELGELVPEIQCSGGGSDRVVTLNRNALDEFLTLSSCSLVRLFDFKKWKGGFGSVEERRSKLVSGTSAETYYTLMRAKLSNGPFVAMRGADVIRVDRAARKRAVQRIKGDVPRQYASFLIWDFERKRDIEWPADESKLGNYFTTTGLPQATSPVFFKPDILLAYRSEPERFRIDSHEIACRGAWSLPYHINEAGQVHAYICDLARLPHEEQLRWKAHNEKRKGGIAERAWVQDFRAEFSEEYDPVDSLHEVARAFPSIKGKDHEVVLWRAGGDLDQVGLVVTRSPKEFQDQILTLTKVVVEGLVARNINKMSKQMKCRDDKLGSVKQLQRLMEKLGVDDDTREEITVPLASLHGVRSSTAAHRGKNEEKDTKGAYRKLLTDCDKALRLLADLVEQGVFVKAVPKP